jgi:polyphosphate glucokinase
VSSALGIDIGGSAIKSAVVDTGTGELLSARGQLPTPAPATPDSVATVIAAIVRAATWAGPVGVTFPAVIQHGVAHSAANVDPSWIGTDVDARFTRATGGRCDVIVLNDADAAGLAEARFGAARGAAGTTIMLTFGTGIGSALLLDGRLVPNTELGHLELDGFDAESRAAASVKVREGLSYPAWAARVSHYLGHVERLFTPDLFVLGGGISADADQWVPLLKIRTPVKVARLLNDAGVVGAAVAAVERRGE